MENHLKKFVFFSFFLFFIRANYIEDYLKIRLLPNKLTREITRAFTEDIVNSEGNESGDNNKGPSVAHLGDGKFVVSWVRGTSPYHVYMQRFSAAGAKVDLNAQVDTSNAANTRGSPSVAHLGDGKFVVSWVRGTSPYHVYMQRFSAAGEKDGAETQVNTSNAAGSMGGPSVAHLGDGKFVVSWVRGTSPYHVYMQRFSAAGEKDGAETQVNSAENSGHRSGGGPSVAHLGDGKFVVTWVRGETSPYHVYMQRFSAAGAADGGETQVSTSGAYQGSGPSVAHLGDGKFVVSWIRGKSPNHFYIQRFSAAGEKDGGETQVNSADRYGSNMGTGPSVAHLGDGKFVVSWIKNTDYEVYIQRFDAAGAKDGIETQVNSEGNHAGPEGRSIVASLGGDRLVVSWIRKSDPEPNNVYIGFSEVAAGTVSGTTKDEDDSGIEGIAIQLKSGESVVASTTTGVDGSYTFSDVTAGDYTVMSGSKDWYRITSAATVDVTVAAGETSAANFTYQKLGQLTITTRTAVGEVVPNVSFSFVGGETISSQTDSSGNFSCEVSVGSYTLTVTTPSWYRSTSDTTVTGTVIFQATETNAFTFQKLGQLTITTRTAVGEVVPNVSFSFVGGETISSQTNSSGNFSCEVSVGSYTLTSSAPDGYQAVTGFVSGAISFQGMTTNNLIYKSTVPKVQLRIANDHITQTAIPRKFVSVGNEFYTQLRLKADKI